MKQALPRIAINSTPFFGKRRMSQLSTIMSFNYPVFLSLNNIHCLVSGFGHVGQRKLAGILPASPLSVLVLDIRPLESFSLDARNLLDHDNVSFACRQWEPGDALASNLVFAATNDREQNDKLASFCRENRILCNNTSNPALGNFIVPATAASHNLSIALGTGGASPILAGKWKKELGQWLEPRSRLAWLMGRLRPHILANSMDSDANKALFQKIASSPLADWLVENKVANCREWLKINVPQISAEALDRMFIDYDLVFR